MLPKKFSKFCIVSQGATPGCLSHTLSDPDALVEAESHLLDVVDAGIRQGLSAEESERQALERFGSVKIVSLAFEKERNNLTQNLLLTFAVIAGFFSLISTRVPIGTIQVFWRSAS